LEKSITEKIKEVGKHGLIYGLGSIAQSAAGFLLLPLYSKYLVPHDFGVFSLIQMIGTIMGAVFYLGVSTALPRSYFDYNDPNDQKKVFNTTLLLLVIGAIVQTIIGVLFSSHISKLIIGSMEYGHLIFINLVSSALTFINTGFLVYLRLLRKSKVVVTTSVVSLFATLSIAYYLLTIRQMGISAPIYAILISQCVTTIFFITYLWRTISIINFSKEEVSIQLKFGIPSVLASLSLMITDWGDRVVMNNMLSTSDVGIYSMGFRIAMIYNIFIMLPFSMIWHPMMMEYRNDKNIKELFNKITYYFTLVSMLLILFCIYLLDNILIVFNFGEDYSRSFPIIPFIMIGLYFNGLQSIFSAGLFYKRKPIYLTYVYLCVGGFNIFLNILLIPIFGVWGAVISALISRFSISAFVFKISGKYFKFELEYLRYLKTIFLFAFMLVVYYVSADFFVNSVLKDGFAFLFAIYMAFYVLLDFKEKNEIKNMFRLALFWK